MIERNVGGLKNHAQKKRQESFAKLDRGIQQLIENGEKINFNTVAQVSNLSKAWLYKEPEVKARIEHLREKHSRSIPQKQRASDVSKDAIVKTLKARVKKIDAENKALKSQLEVVYGQLGNAKELQRKLERLEAENAKLKDKLYSPISSEPGAKKVIELKPASGISERIQNELETLGIPLSSTLNKQIKNASEECVITAIEAFKQQVDSNIIRSPGAWLSAAIRDTWKPNEAIGTEQEQSQDSFEEWYDLAREYGVVTQCRQDDGKWLVKENTSQWHSYEDFSQKWTLEYLRRVVKTD
ncbi:MAG: hypothetical protein Tsb0014_09900 [Pleurocapsa sp.]